MPPSRKSTTKTPDQKISKEERLALSRQKARAWSQQQTASASKAMKTPSKRKVSIPATTSKIPSKQSLRKSTKKEEFLDEDERKLPLSKKERLARARAKSRSWAEKHSPTPAKVKSRDIEEEEEEEEEDEVITGPTGTPVVSKDEEMEEEMIDAFEEEMDESEEEEEPQPMETFYSPVPMNKKELLQQSREKAKQWANNQKRRNTPANAPTQVKRNEPIETWHTPMNKKDTPLNNKQVQSQEKARTHKRTQRSTPVNTPASAGRAKRIKPSNTPDDRSMADAEDYFMSPETTAPPSFLSPPQQLPPPRPMEPPRSTIPTFPTISNTPEQFYDTQQRQEDSRLIGRPFPNMIRNDNTASETVNPTEQYYDDIYSETQNQHSHRLTPQTNAPTHDTTQNTTIHDANQPTPVYQTTQFHEAIQKQDSYQLTPQTNTHTTQQTPVYQTNDRPQFRETIQTPSKTVRIDESKNNIHPSPSFWTYFNIFDSCMGFFLKVILLLFIFTFLTYSYSIIATHHPISTFTIADDDTNYIPPCFLPSSTGSEIPIHVHRTCNQNETQACPNHGTCNGGFLLHCNDPFTITSRFDSCVPSATILEELEEELKNLTAVEICSSISFHQDDESVLFTLPSKYEQLFDYLDASQYIIENNTIGFTHQYIEENTLPISTLCSIQFHCRNLVIFFLQFTWMISLKLFWILLEYPLPSSITVITLYILKWIIQKRNLRSKEKALISKIQSLIYTKLQTALSIQVNHLRDDIAFDLYPYSLKERKRMNFVVWPKVVSIVKYDSRIKRVNRGRSEYWEWSVKDDKKDC